MYSVFAWLSASWLNLVLFKIITHLFVCVCACISVRVERRPEDNLRFGRLLLSQGSWG